MKFSDIKFNETMTPPGVQALIKFKDYELSIVQNNVSYGGKMDLYEIGVFKDGNLVELPGITEPGDSVKGFLTEEGVEAIIKKMHLVSGSDPEAV